MGGRFESINTRGMQVHWQERVDSWRSTSGGWVADEGRSAEPNGGTRFSMWNNKRR